MSMNEMESKIRELRQLQSLIEEARAEAEAKDELDGVSRMFRAFAPVDIPEGLAKADLDYNVCHVVLPLSIFEIKMI